ncbi:poly(U)-specific endoribonuclease-B-like isoform X2 [Lytechinus pictus]|uniref:poly(U)-specific endoribonuclease-B-like isoform X2 n=1 Tax=Lytechinus pictus TaxID=7653 RepID=UPI0030B9D732
MVSTRQYFNTFQLRLSNNMAGKGSQEFTPDAELSAICNKLWELDENRLEPGVDYEIDLQGYTSYGNKVDQARDPLFSRVDEGVLQKPTFKAFISLLDNYTSETGVSEWVTSEEIKENQIFIDRIMETKVMQLAYKVLLKKGKISGTVRDFKHDLYDLWFKLYKRTRGREKADSSGFEHVFVGETKNKEVIGFHNWIQFYLEEKRGNVDYTGWIPPRRRGKGKAVADNSAQLVKLQFKWKDTVKPAGSSFIGTSPEFEMALYTILYYIGKKAYQLEIEDYDVEIVVHSMCNKLGSAYPKALSQV